MICSTAGGSLTIVISTSACAATSRGLAPSCAPSCTSSSARAFVRFHTTNRKSRLQQVSRHWLAHQPQSDKSDRRFHVSPLSQRCNIRGRRRRIVKKSFGRRRAGNTSARLARGLAAMGPGRELTIRNFARLQQRQSRIRRGFRRAWFFFVRPAKNALQS